MISNSSTLSKPLKEATKEASYVTYFGGGTDSSSKEESKLKFTSNTKLLCGGGSSKELSNSLFEGKSALKIGSEESKNSKEYCEKSKELELVFNFGLEEGREISSEKSYHAGYVTAIFKYILIDLDELSTNATKKKLSLTKLSEKSDYFTKKKLLLFSA